MQHRTSTAPALQVRKSHLPVYSENITWMSLSMKIQKSITTWITVGQTNCKQKPY